MHERPLESIFRPAMVLVTGRSIGFVAAFAIPMVMARLFSQEEFGTYKQLFLIYATLLGIAQLGMAESLFYFLPNEKSRSGAYILNSLLVLGAAGFACLAILWFFKVPVSRLLNNPDLVSYIPYIGFYLLFMLMAVVLEIAMTVRKQHLAASVMYACSDIARAILYIVPVLLYTDLHWLMLGAVAFSAIRFATMLIYVKREFGTTLRPDKPLLRSHLGYAIPFGLAGLIETMQINFHLYAVSYNFDVAMFAIYTVGCLQVPLTDFLTSSTCNVMMTNMRERMIEGDKKGACAIWLDTIRKLSLILCPMVAAMVIMAHELIIVLFTETYAASVPIFVIWTLGTLFALLITNGVLRVLAETRFLLLQNLIQLALIIVMIQWFIGNYGILGAVMVTIFTTAICKVLAMWRIKSVLDVRFSQLLPWAALMRCFLIASVATLPSLAIKANVEMPELLLLMVMGAAYGLSYLLLLFLWGPMHLDEKQMLRQWLQTPAYWAYRTLKA